MQAVVKLYGDTGSGPLSSIAATQGFSPFKKLATEEELKSAVLSIRDIKPASDLHKKQLEQIITHLESDIAPNLQFIMIPATPNIEEGIEHQLRLFLHRAADKPASLTFAVCLQYRELEFHHEFRGVTWRYLQTDLNDMSIRITALSSYLPRN